VFRDVPQPVGARLARAAAVRIPAFKRGDAIVRTFQLDLQFADPFFGGAFLGGHALEKQDGSCHTDNQAGDEWDEGTHFGGSGGKS
jgi:hypothetical protein